MKKLFMLVSVILLALALASCTARVCYSCDRELDEYVEYAEGLSGPRGATRVFICYDCLEELWAELLAMLPDGAEIYQPYNLSVGDTIILGGRDVATAFGTLNRLSALSWVVADVVDNRALLVMDGAFPFDQIRQPWQDEIVAVPRGFHNAHGSVTWETSDMRAFLNGAFYESVFREEEREWIIETEIITNDNPTHGTPGATTRDRIFLLSVEEFNRFEALLASGSDEYTQPEGWLWLRSPGNHANFVATVRDGNIVYTMANTGFTGGGRVLPAVWVEMAS